MIEFCLLFAALAGATASVGWWGIAVVAALWSLIRRGAPWRAGAAAAAAWLLLLGFTVSWGPLSRLVPRVGGAVGLPGWAVVLLAPVFAWLLAWSAARITWRAPSSRTSR